MYNIYYNDALFSTCEEESHAIGLAFNLHKNSNVSHKVVVTKDLVKILNLFVD